MVLEGEVPLGVFSERDLMERVMIRGRAPAEVLVREMMTRDLLTAGPEESYVDCLMKTQLRGCWHLPIVGDGRVIAMISLRDLLRIEIDEMEEEIRWMNAYIHAVPPDRMEMG